MNFKIFLIAAMMAVGSTTAQYGYHPKPEPARYNFDWSVEDGGSGNFFGHQESRDGGNTEGSYYVLLPDGRTQKVRYYVNGDSGFVADVAYEGEARYPRPYSPPRYKSY